MNNLRHSTVVLLPDAAIALDDLPPYISRQKFLAKVIWNDYNIRTDYQHRPDSKYTPCRAVIRNSQRVLQAISDMKLI